MKIKQGIEKAIEKGWKHYGVDIPFCDDITELWYIDNGKEEPDMLYVEVILLDPKFWKALAKAEDWETGQYGDLYKSEAEFRHHDFLINLWSGESLEKAFDFATSYFIHE